MSRWFPYPALSACLAAMWLLLNQALTPGHVLLGAAFGLAGGLVLAGLMPPTLRIRRRALAIAHLFWMMFVDIVRSNVAVARIALNPRTRGRTSGFLTMPLEVRHPGALAVLACVITATPGTSWARYDAAGSTLTIHILDLVDEQAWIRLFKDRYERRLAEIFE
jgi:multicomponent K+:H+ antiporter subunit E